MTGFAALMAMALAGVLHCAGMCGPLAMVAAGGRRRFASLGLFLVGKASTYVLLGTLAGALGHSIVRAAPLGNGARLLGFAGGGLLLAAGLESLGVIKLGRARWLSPVLRTLTASGLTGKLLLGSASGLIPCPMTYAFVALAGATASPVQGAGVMLALAAVTTIPLCVCGLAGASLPVRWRRAPQLSGALMLAAAGMVVWRGLAIGAGCH